MVSSFQAVFSQFANHFPHDKWLGTLSPGKYFPLQTSRGAGYWDLVHKVATPAAIRGGIGKTALLLLL